MDQNRQLRYTSAGEQIDLRLERSVRLARTIAKCIFLAITGWVIYWCAPAIIAYFTTRELIGPAQNLTGIGFSPLGILIIMIAASVILVWWSLGTLYDLAVLHLQRDTFLLRSDTLTVNRRRIFTKTLEFKPYEPLELRLSPETGALEAKKDSKSVTLTNLGSAEDRKWLLELVEQRYRFPKGAAQGSSIERVATYIVERRPDHSVLIASSRLSTMGCATMSAVICSLCIVVAVLLFKRGSGAGVIPLMFFVAFAVGGLSSLNSRTVEAGPRKLLVRWSSPIGRLLRKIARSNPLLSGPFGEGTYERSTGVLALRTTVQSKREPSFKIMLCSKPADSAAVEEEDDQQSEDIDDFESEEEYSISEPLVEEDLVLELSGSTNRPAAEYILSVLAETTGFETEQY